MSQLPENYIFVTDLVGAEKMSETPVWKDVAFLISERIDFLHEQLETVTEFAEIRYIQGQLFALRGMLETPDRLLDAVTEQIEQEKDNG